MRNYAIEPESLIQSQNGINVAFIESQCPKITAIAHIHSSIEFLYFTRGEFKVTINEESFLLHEGDLILFPKHSIHSATA
ncbi:MAG: cupin domain-containing protein, partial [Oscillospiraceae bacterium]|nr:cupin domain-containing protein [Oscillospiraceae bacterium]